MKTLMNTLILSLSALSLTAHAGREPSGELDYPPAVASTAELTRAAVRAQLAEARADGQLQSGEETLVLDGVQGQSATREAVRAELRQARDAGLVSFGEDGSVAG
ncbi:DUF4148 domain-containing protein [Bordetella genomosp. 13]|uniref:DUF4148 domain-containing protein n=1 Tax=Bordetella genomosp. 13 TaxID=463040 RepID=A0A1W6ZBS3_9BORD|nr:DUF4148 domain-containing protein [Bordetella genomosp. 13]ARP94828.1 hypothetical protein CAL15_10785 [Bordetella genomosp. 13]